MKKMILFLMQIRIIYNLIYTWCCNTMEITKSRRKGSNLNQFIPVKTWKRKLITPSGFFSFGNRYTNIIHTWLRNYCILNYDLCKWSIIDGPLGSCGKHGGLYHFFFACKNYSIGRNTLFVCNAWIGQYWYKSYDM